MERERVLSRAVADREGGNSAKPALQKALERFNAVRDRVHDAASAVAGEVGRAHPPERFDSATAADRSQGGSDDDHPPPPEYESLPAPSGSQRHEARRKQAERDAKRRARFVEKCVADGIPLDAIPPDVPAHVYRQSQAILADWTGKLTAKALEREARTRSGYPIALLRNAVGGDAADFKDYNTRVVIAAALLLLSLARRVKRKGRWTLLVAGFGIGNIAACLHRPGDPSAVLSRNAIGGGGRKTEAQRDAAARARAARATERGSWSARSRQQWQGERATAASHFEPVLRRLRDVGFLYAQQLPAQCVKAWERDSRPGNERHVRNRYWLACLSFPEVKRQKRGPTQLAGELWGMLQAEFTRLNAIGWDWIQARLPKPAAPS